MTRGTVLLRGPETSQATTRVLIAAGSGRYSDPWHPLAATAQAIGGVLDDAGAEVEITSDVDAALLRLAEVDLLVVNAADPWRNGETGVGALAGAAEGLAAALDRGIGILAIHNSVSSLRDYPIWRDALGGRWVPGDSSHPPIGSATIPVLAPEHEITRGLDAVEVFDELYCHLEVDDDIHVLLGHELDGVVHPVLWTRTRGPSRIVVSTLGHDERSFHSTGHRALLARAAAWAVARDGPHP